MAMRKTADFDFNDLLTLIIEGNILSKGSIMVHKRVHRILIVILCGFACILARVWYLSTIQRPQFIEKAIHAGRRTTINPVERGPILDRFQIPLATNKVVYNACIRYADIAQIPKIQWMKDKNGKRQRHFSRLSYIQELAKMIGKKLDLHAEEVEDFIHAKAALFPHTSFAIKTDLTEQQYAWLKIAEKDWPGVHAEKGLQRIYPQGRVASHIVGYMGAINAQEYQAILQEQRNLRTYVSERDEGSAPILLKGYQDPLEVRERLAELEEKAYTHRDDIGKMGIELAYDKELRGYRGKQQVEVDFRGNPLGSLPGAKHSIAGEQITLSLSVELQKYAEQLLTEYEVLREERGSDGMPLLSTPWIRGGAIVALDPNTGEILALASYPRFDPNDFVAKTPAVTRWLEGRSLVQVVWDGIRPLERERFQKGAFYDEAVTLTFERYLDAILSQECKVRNAIEKMHTLQTACAVQHVAEELRALVQPEFYAAAMDLLFPDHFPHKTLSAQEKKTVLLRIGGSFAYMQNTLGKTLASIPYNRDKMLAIDLCRLFVDAERFSPELLSRIGGLSLAQYFTLTQQVNALLHTLKKTIAPVFREREFATWRKEHFKTFLKQKRAEEQEKKTYARPYTDYLEMQERSLFEAFWARHRLPLLHAWLTGETHDDASLLPYLECAMHIREHQIEKKALSSILSSLSLEEGISFFQTMRNFSELNLPLYGSYQWGNSLQDLAAAFYPEYGYSYMQSFAYRQSAPQGSIFKLAIAYQALMERYKKLQVAGAQNEDLNPFTFNDESHPSRHMDLKQVLGTTVDGKPIRRLYKNGVLPRSLYPMGLLDLARAIEQSSNTYFSLLAADYLPSPKQIVHATKTLGFGEKTGIDLPGENPGLLPDDLHINPSGLYAFAIGQHSLLVTPLQTAIMLSAFANGGEIFRPHLLVHMSGREPALLDTSLFYAPPTLFKEPLQLLGIPFALFATAEPLVSSPYMLYGGTELLRKIDMPKEVRSYLLRSMHRVTSGEKGKARPKAIHCFSKHPEWRRTYLDLHKHIPGKSGTAEYKYKQTIDVASVATIRNHAWFGGIGFSDDEEKKPEIVIVAFLRFSKKGGKEAAPIIANLIQKWRDIQSRKEPLQHSGIKDSGKIVDRTL